MRLNGIVSNEAARRQQSAAAGESRIAAEPPSVPSALVASVGKSDAAKTTPIESLPRELRLLGLRQAPSLRAVVALALRLDRPSAAVMIGA